MCRYEDQQEAKKANEIGMIYIPSLIEQKKVSVTEKKKNGAYSIEETRRYKQSEDAEQHPMNVKSIAGPRLDPGKSVILEQKLWLNPTLGDSTARGVPQRVPSHQQAERNPEKN